MQFIKTAFWVVLAVAIALFAKANWVLAPSYSGYVPVKLWGDLILETRLPVLIVVAFLLGFLPTWIYGTASKWRLGRKLESVERALHSAVAPTTAVTAVSDVAPASETPPPPSSGKESATTPVQP